MITATPHRLKKSHWKLKPRAANTPNIWAWKRPEELLSPWQWLEQWKTCPFWKNSPRTRWQEGLQVGHHLLVPATDGFVRQALRTLLHVPRCHLLAPELVCGQARGCLTYPDEWAEHFKHFSAHSTEQNLSIDLENATESVPQIAGKVCLWQPEFAMDLLSVCCLGHEQK